MSATGSLCIKTHQKSKQSISMQNLKPAYVSLVRYAILHAWLMDIVEILDTHSSDSKQTHNLSPLYSYVILNNKLV